MPLDFDKLCSCCGREPRTSSGTIAEEWGASEDSVLRTRCVACAEELLRDCRMRFPAEDDSEWRGQEIGSFAMGHLRIFWMPGSDEGHPDVEVYGEAHWQAKLLDERWFLECLFNMEDRRIPHGVVDWHGRDFPFPQIRGVEVSADDVRRLMYDHTWDSQERMLRDLFSRATDNDFYRKIYPIGSRIVIDGTSID